jgi:hypothetical protein
LDPRKEQNLPIRDIEMKEEGFGLVLCLSMFLLVALLGIAAMQTAIFGTIIAGNGLESQKAFWIAESGLQDAQNRLDQASNVDAFLDIDIPELSSPVSYGGGTYAITAIDHDSTRGTVVVRSVGSRSEAKKIVEATFRKLPFPLPGALYSKNLVTVNGANTTINGNDACGGSNKPGIITRIENDKGDLVNSDLNESINFQNGQLFGNGIFEPVSGKSEVTAVEAVTEINSSQNYSLQGYINFYKGVATYVSADASIQGDAKVLSPDGEYTTINKLWGSNEIKIDKKNPNQPVQLKQNAEPNVIYLNPPVTNQKKEVTLTGIEGQGLLLIDGSANLSGGFVWYGLIIASGGIKFTGQGGGGKNITGAVMVGESGFDLDSELLGSTAIYYCSTATHHLSTVRMISWREIRN